MLSSIFIGIVSCLICILLSLDIANIKETIIKIKMISQIIKFLIVAIKDK